MDKPEVNHASIPKEMIDNWLAQAKLEYPRACPEFLMGLAQLAACAESDFADPEADVEDLPGYDGGITEVVMNYLSE